MNIIITDRCNRACPYCFAKSKVEFGAGYDCIKSNHHNIGLDTMDWYFDFLDRSNYRIVKILGGEPTLHPQLPEIVTRAINRNFEVIIFTNGLWSDGVQGFFENHGDDRVSFLFNINEPSKQKQWENDRQKQSLRIGGPRAMIGFNIYQKQFDILFCKELINEFSLKRQIRLGLASPIVREKNAYLKNDSLKFVGKRLCEQLRVLEADDILGSFDCGFPLCMFEEKDLGSLTITTKGFLSNCEAVIDVDAELNAWPCFPLGKLLNINLRDFNSLQEVESYYSKKLAPLRNLGSMDECINCKFLKRGQCCGGCLGRTVRAIEDSGDLRLLEKIQKSE